MDLTRPFSILIADDEINIRNSFKFTLLNAGYTEVATVGGAREILPAIEKYNAGLVLLDLIMPEISGEEMLKLINTKFPEVIVIIVTGVNDVDTAVRCIKYGAQDYLQKPVDKERLVSTVKSCFEILSLRRENALIKQSFLYGGEDDAEEDFSAFKSIIAVDEKMKTLFKYAKAVSVTSEPILINGETGTGKELFPRVIHELSGRKGKLVSVNTAGVDSNVFSDTLFGHTKGAFTGALSERAGLIEKAGGGTVFLDEIGDLGPESQVKLLRLIQEKEYMPLGSDTVKSTNARIIAATNRDLKKMVADGKFREDLYYRLQTHLIKIPPLRKRPDDIKPLFDFFLGSAFGDMNRKVPAYPGELVALLKNYRYPGNVRELRAMTYDAAAKHRSGILSMSSFERYIGFSGKRQNFPEGYASDSVIFPEPLPSLAEVNELLIKEALKRADGNQSLAAKLVGVSQQTLNYRVRKMKKSLQNVT